MNIFKVREVKTPARANPTDAGIDFFVPEDFQQIDLLPNHSVLIPSGIKANVPEGHALIAMNKSGVASKKKFLVGACVIDEPYTGEIHINLHNVGNLPQTIKPGDKIVQVLCIPISYVDVDLCETEAECFGTKLEESTRGAGGFGSTGTK